MSGLRVVISWHNARWLLTGCTGYRRQGVASRGAQPVSYKYAFGGSNLGPTFGRHMTNYSKADTQNL
jgi:hypothetical protein